MYNIDSVKIEVFITNIFINRLTLRKIIFKTILNLLSKIPLRDCSLEYFSSLYSSGIRAGIHSYFDNVPTNPEPRKYLENILKMLIINNYPQI